MHMLSDNEIERLKTDSNFTISHLAFCLSEEKQKSQRLAKFASPQIEPAAKARERPQPGKASRCKECEHLILHTSQV